MFYDILLKEGAIVHSSNVFIVMGQGPIYHPLKFTFSWIVLGVTVTQGASVDSSLISVPNVPTPKRRKIFILTHCSGANRESSKLLLVVETGGVSQMDPRCAQASHPKLSNP